MKIRHKKNIDEKYERKSLMDDYHLYIKGNKDDNKKIFDNIPYLGIFYLPVEISRRIKFFCEYEKGDIKNIYGEMKKCKVLDNDSNHHMRFIYYDDHHHDTVICEIYKDNYYLDGNILKERY